MALTPTREALLALGPGRIGLGCMRLSTSADRDDDNGLATLRAAAEAGVRVFDTARAYGLGEDDLGHNERLLARAALPHDAQIVSKGGMGRPGGGWRPDGRAKTLRRDAEQSAETLGRPVDLWLLHAPDPRVKLETSLRAMAKILTDGTARAVGLSNVSRDAIRRADGLVELSAVQIELSTGADTALRGGVLSLCDALKIPVLAHRPLGGPKGAARIGRDPALGALADANGRTPHQLLLDWWSERVIPLAGATRPETAAQLGFRALEDSTKRALDARYPNVMFAGPLTPPPSLAGDVVMIMGVPGAGKSTHARAFETRGYLRLNRDARGGSMRALHAALDRALGEGVRRVVLDNTYLTRAQRADVVRIAWSHGVAVRGIHLDVPPDVARARVCRRLLDELGALPPPETLARSRTPGVFPPTRHHRMVAELEPPELDEGFPTDSLPQTAPSPTAIAAHVFADNTTVAVPAGHPTLRVRVRDGTTDEAPEDGVDLAICPHRSGPPRCWCRPPLPGLVLAWAEKRGIAPTAIQFHGGGSAFERMAASLGARWRPAVGPASDAG